MHNRYSSSRSLVVILCCFLAALIAIQAAAAAKRKDIQASLTSNWASTSILAEAGEFFATESDSQFWKFAETAGEKSSEQQQHLVSEKVLYESVLLPTIQTLESNSDVHKLLKFALATRHYSPALEVARNLGLDALRQHAIDRNISVASLLPETVSAFVSINNQAQIVTDVDKLEAAITTAASTPSNRVEVFDFDHVYPMTAKSASVVDVVLYAPIGSPEFYQFHNKLKALTEQYNVRYIARYWDVFATRQLRSSDSDAATADSMPLQGFGIELQIKNMEYNAMDDRAKLQQAAQDAQEAAVSDADDIDSEAEIEGLLFQRLLQYSPNQQEELQAFRDALMKSMATKSSNATSDITAIKAWEIKDLGVQAAQRILNAASPLNLMRDISQNFPMLGASLARIKVNDQLRSEIVDNQRMIQPATSLLLVNGIAVNVETLNPFNFMTLLRDEIKLGAHMSALRLSDSSAEAVIHAPMKSNQEPRFRFHTPLITYLNDVDNDKRYMQFPQTLWEILQPMYWGSYRFCRRNLFTVVLVLDPSVSRDLVLFAEAQKMVNAGYPIRFGVFLSGRNDVADYVAHSAKPKSKRVIQAVDVDVAGGIQPPEAPVVIENRQSPFTPKSLASQLVKIFVHLLETNSRDAATQFLLEQRFSDGPSHASMRSAYKKFDKSGQSLDAVLNSDDLNDKLRERIAFLADNGFVTGGSPLVMMNGVVLPEANSLESMISEALRKEFMHAQRLVSNKVLHDGQRDLYEAILDDAKALSLYNKRVVESVQYVVLSPSESPLSELSYLTNTARPNIKIYSHLLALDLSTRNEIQSALTLLTDALTHISKSTNARLGILLRKTAPNTQQRLLERLLIDTLPKTRDAALSLRIIESIADLFSDSAHITANEIIESSLPAIIERLKREEEFSANEDAFAPFEALIAQQQQPSSSSFETTIQQHVDFCSQRFAAVTAESDTTHIVVLNGRVIKLSASAGFSQRDFRALEEYEYKERIATIESIIRSATFDASLAPSQITSELKSNVLMSALSAVATAYLKHGERNKLPPQLKTAHCSLELNSDSETSSGNGSGGKFGVRPNIVAIVDPLSKEAQKISPFLIIVKETFALPLRVILNPNLELSGAPLKSYYRYVLEPELGFSTTGRIEGAVALFKGLPARYILTMGVDTPESWLVESSKAVYDLDNIPLQDLPPSEHTVYAEYSLSNIIITGSCYDETSGSPPRGLQLILTSGASLEKQHYASDTLVMSNLGYFQLKASPRVWAIRLAEGPHSEIYSIIGGETASNDDSVVMKRIIVRDFDGASLKLKVKKRAGKEGVDLLKALEQASSSKKGGLWSTLSSKLWGGSASEASSASNDTRETINIFSIASGHMYERLLKIMMLSVTKHTKQSKVKFWLIKNYFSPQFKEFLPKMAKQYGFEVELVTYKWPSWLFKQTEKQRIIWAYKVLFLDVLFPLKVEKIIYVDADQITRADMTELWNMDLNGRALAYTPFCDSRKETEGFRFWKQGYWSTHLRGRPYHISALYVVDIARFRQMAAGDHYRMIYDSLARDPNSLSNLDQDLPNYTQHMVPIHSLPQEWLWCETWCDDASLAKAKTIDLCNNPMTKEPKLKSARRIVAEWPAYDEEISQFEASLEK